MWNNVFIHNTLGYPAIPSAFCVPTMRTDDLVNQPTRVYSITQAHTHNMHAFDTSQYSTAKPRKGKT